jgi:alpha-1,2-mannosyltransferase
VPLWNQLRQGQLNLILLVLVTGVWVADRSTRPAWAGVFLGTAAALKLFPGFLLFYFLVRRQWQVVAAAALTLAALLGLTSAMLGPEPYASYLEKVVPHLAGCQGLGYNASLFGFWGKLFDPGKEPIQPLWHSQALAKVGSYLSCAVVVAVLAWVVRRARSRAERDQAFGLAVTAMLLVTPLVWDHYFVLLLVPLAVLWSHLPTATGVRALFLLLVLPLWIHPMAWWQAFVSPEFTATVLGPGLVLSILSLQCYALLGLFALGVVVAACDRSRVRGPTERATT